MKITIALTNGTTVTIEQEVEPVIEGEPVIEIEGEPVIEIEGEQVKQCASCQTTDKPLYTVDTLHKGIVIMCGNCLRMDVLPNP